jgi:DNA-binding MarR family transcriptional regulator
MRKTIKALVVTLLLTLGFTSAYAGSGHSHASSKMTIERNAKYELGQLIKKGKLEQSWKNAKQTSMEKQGLISKEWVIGFTNESVTDAKKRVLYIYLTTYGKFIGANYNGK